SLFFFFHHPPTPELSTLSLHDALPIYNRPLSAGLWRQTILAFLVGAARGGAPLVLLLRIVNLLHLLGRVLVAEAAIAALSRIRRSEEHTSELQSRENLVCRLLLEKKKK